MRGPEADAPVVVKIGGGLLQADGALGAVALGVASLARQWRVVVVPGGGPLADAVRRLDETIGLSDDAAHWMAMLAMDQYAHVLAERLERAVLVEEPGGIAGAFGGGRVAVLAPSRWMRSADVLPHTWDATSDSVAAFVAGALGARYLVLIKPVDGDPAALVDPCFGAVVPVGLPWAAVGWRRLGEVPEMVERSASAG
ncbi:MAG TPA: hypothetical protein VEB59_06400 [Gemmatimonadales bacterium]|nr:hypothetical protein [Gemmatimonadales bacterium]